MNIQKELKIKAMYVQGVSVKQICKECTCSTNTISKVLDKYNIPKRTKRKLNKDFSKFYDLTLPETQYWLGYICADGNIEYNTKSRVYKVSLFSKEEEPIQKYVSYFGTETVTVYKRPTGIIEACIHSKELAEYFINVLNIPPNKSLILNPNIKYTPNFILGYFDGDGCIVNSSANRTRYESSITCGSKVFLEKIKQQLDKNNIHSTITKHTDCNAYVLNIYRKEDSKKFYYWLYRNKITCLSRKLNNYVALFGNIENNKLGELQEDERQSAAKQKK